MRTMSQKIYLLTALHALNRRLSKNGVALPSLLSTHLSLLASERALLDQLPYAKAVPQLPKRYTSSETVRANAKVWMARLDFEKAFSTPGPDEDLTADVLSSWKDARAAVQGEGALAIWTWGIPSEDSVDDEAKAQAVLNLLEVRARDRRNTLR